MIACAGDEIFVDPSSIVGSIGVISAGFGFVGLIDRIGVERRVYTSGKSKSVLDPFKPENKSDVAYLKSLQEEIHGVFIDLVKESRGERLGDDPDLFTGKFWTGRRGIELGLVDALGDIRTVLRERFGEKVQTRVISAPRGLFGRRALAGSGSTSDIGAGAVSELASLADEEALWRSYGLAAPRGAE